MLFGGNMSSNISKQKRERMMQFLSKLKEEHKDDDSMLIALGEIEAELNAKKYGLVWEEHEEAVDVMMKDNVPVFTECADKEIHASDSDDYNFLLEGDNLHSLRLLEKTHKGKIDVIYIDPPYNKDKDFIYNDTIVDKADTFKHSKWASFMSCRLCIAKSLLSDYGCIFISCDDNELPSLRLICDELFGETNFEGHIHWRRRHNQPNDKTKLIAIVAEHILVYSKNKEKHKKFGVGKVDITGTFSNPDNDPMGPWASKPWKSGNAQSGCRYTIISPTGKTFDEEWLGEESTFKALLADGRIIFPKKGNGSPRKKYYQVERKEEGQCATNWWLNDKFGCNQDATDELKNIFYGASPFDNPKPTKLLKAIVKLASVNRNAIVLDFFAGSGTTAQAVLELNKEDGGNRKFILCTNNENGICENITYQRIKTVITGKREDGSDYSDGIPANLKYYRTDFVSKNEEYLSEALLEHVAEMIQLEHGIKLDGKRYITVMNDDDVDRLAEHWSEYPDVKALYVSKNVLFTTEQNALFKDVDIHIIPDYYFNFELREVGETW